MGKRRATVLTDADGACLHPPPPSEVILISATLKED